MNRVDLQRGINFTAAIAGLIVTFPIMGLIALTILTVGRHPVIFMQTRIGKNRRRSNVPVQNDRRQRDLGGQPFTIYKFQTMLPGDGREVWATTDDPRITRLGRFLRQSRLDELPQLLNVLRGDMNLVGPRPEQPTIFASLREQIPHYHRRQDVLPGITGWAQINHHYDQSIEDVRIKLQYDLEYVSTRSATRDLTIMARTVPVMLLRRGAK